LVLYTKPPEVKVLEANPLEYEGTIVLPVFQEKDKPVVYPLLKEFDTRYEMRLSELIDNKKFVAKKGETVEFVRGKTTILLLGLGKEPDAETVRRAFAKAVKKYLNNREEVLLVVSPLNKEDLMKEALVGALLGSYVLEEFKSEKKRKLSRLLVDAKIDVQEPLAIAEGVYLARDVANTPPNHIYPEKLAQHVRELFTPLGVEVEVFDYERLVKEGFGGIVSVGKGSSKKPVLIVLKYKNGSNKPLALVGKTIVFDSGGINLKPSHGMTSMKADKAGGAAVLGAMWIIAKMKLPINIFVLLPAAINVPGGESYLPSDVIKMWDGTWLEVGNTDAEGRIVLSDAVAYASKGLEAETIITFATLTGAVVFTLGSLIAGLFTKDEDLRKKLEEASKRSGDKLWPLPMDDDYRSLLMKSATTGDVGNVATRWGDPIFASFLLERFAHGKKFAHIDMAGPGIGAEGPITPPDYWPKGAPGYGARLAYELAKMLVEEN
jgi:leucyl aminopeptidase